MKGNDFLDYEGLAKYHDRLIESIDEKVANVKKQLEKRDNELLHTVGVIQDDINSIQDIHKAISGILNVFYDNITWQDE